MITQSIVYSCPVTLPSPSWVRANTREREREREGGRSAITRRKLWSLSQIVTVHVQHHLPVGGVVECRLAKERTVSASERVALGAVAAPACRDFGYGLSVTFCLALQLGTATHTVLAGSAPRGAVLAGRCGLGLQVLIAEQVLLRDGQAGLKRECLGAGHAVGTGGSPGLLSE